jgi:transposase
MMASRARGMTSSFTREPWVRPNARGSPAKALTPTTRSSGDLEREQGISKAGNVLIRLLAIELAWSWVRRQPTSALSQWYRARFAGGGSRQRRVGIVAVARKLLIALWRYLETGVLPEGAVRKA